MSTNERYALWVTRASLAQLDTVQAARHCSATTLAQSQASATRGVHNTVCRSPAGEAPAGQQLPHSNLETRDGSSSTGNSRVRWELLARHELLTTDSMALRDLRARCGAT